MKRRVTEIYVDGELQPPMFEVVQECRSQPVLGQFMPRPQHGFPGRMAGMWWLKAGERYMARLADDPVVEFVEETETEERWRVTARRWRSENHVRS